MKKLLFSAALSLGIVASASAATVNLCSSLSSEGTNRLCTEDVYSFTFGTTNSGITSMTATNVQTWLSEATTSTLYQTTVSGTLGTNTSIGASYSSTDGTFGFQNTYNYGGAIVGWSYDLSDADLSSSVSVSLSYSDIKVGNESCTNNIVGYVAIVYQTNDTWTIATSSSFTTSYSTTGNASLSLNGVTLSSSTIYIIAYTDAACSGSGTGYRISGTLSATATYTAVPEPSAFGLLAGLGALAMVVSRRRRRSRRAA